MPMDPTIIRAPHALSIGGCEHGLGSPDDRKILHLETGQHPQECPATVVERYTPERLGARVGHPDGAGTALLVGEGGNEHRLAIRDDVETTQLSKSRAPRRVQSRPPFTDFGMPSPSYAPRFREYSPVPAYTVSGRVGSGDGTDRGQQDSVAHRSPARPRIRRLPDATVGRPQVGG